MAEKENVDDDDAENISLVQLASEENEEKDFGWNGKGKLWING